MDKNSHPVQEPEMDFTPSYPAFTAPLSPIPSSRDGRPETPGADSNLSTFSSLSMNERQKHDSFMLSGTVFLITSDGKTLSLPVPSQSPYDPLNWSWQKRALAFFPIAIYSMTCLVLTQGTSLTMKGLGKQFPEEESKPFTTETLVTAPTLFMGVGAFFWVPLTHALGRRVPFIMASIVTLLATVGAGLSSSFYQLLVCVCFLGFAEGFSLSVIFLIIIDLTFIHQRPWAIAMVWSIAGFLALTTMGTTPWITDHGMEWHRFYYIWTFPAAISCLSVILFFPETYFKRPTVAYDGLTIIQSASEKLTIYEGDGTEWDTYNKTLPSAPSRNWFQHLFDQLCFRATHASWKSMLYCYPQILFCFFNPLIFWVVIMTAVNFAGMMYIGATYSLILSAPPYRLPSELLILVNMSSGVGSLLAWPLGGALVGYVLKKMSKRNRGVREAEHYLFGYVLPVLTGALSTLIYGFAVHYHWHFTTYYLAYGLNGFSFIALAITNTLWVTEAFPRWAAAALVVVGGGSYISSFAMSFALVPWINAQGYLLVGVELFAAQIVTGLVMTPIAFWGKGLRQRIHGRWAERREGALRPL